MKTRFLYWWDLLRERLWFIPSVLTVGAFALVCVTIWTDRWLEVGSSDLLPWLDNTPESARVVLGSLISALVTVLGLAFSLSMLAVSQTAAQYGPRLIRSIFDRNVMQYVMGLYLSTIVVCMVVLQSIRDQFADGNDFTPNLSVLLAEALGTACLFGLLAFANHVASCMRAEKLVAQIYKDALASISEFCEEDDRRQAKHASADERFNPRTKRPAEASNAIASIALTSPRTGYLQAIEFDQLMETAGSREERLDVIVRPGDFVFQDSRIAAILSDDSGENDLDDQSRQAYQGAFLFGLIRTPRQDVESAIWELVEAGVRALSPGVNDAVTAINVVDYVSAVMRRLAEADWPGEYLSDGEGKVRIRTKPFTFENTLDAGFDQLRQNAGANVAVHCRLLEGLLAIAEVCDKDENLDAVKRQAEMVRDQAHRSIQQTQDREDIDERFADIQQIAVDSNMA